MKEILLRYIRMENSGTESYFDADEIIELLDHFEDTSDFKHYEKVLDLGKKLHPNNIEIKIRLCKLLIHKKEYGEAIRLINKIGDHDSHDLHLLQLECFCATNKYDKVITFIESHQLEKNVLEDIFEYITQVLNDLNKEDEAFDFIKRGLAFFPDNLILKEELCYYLEIKRETKQALRVCQELIDENPYSSEYWYTQGRLYFFERDYDNAIDSFDFALACDDSDQEIKIKKGYCLFMNGNYEKAIEIYLELLSEDSTLYERVQPYLAECYMKTEHFENAYFIFRDILKKIDVADNLHIYKNYIHCCIETERDREATKNLLETARNLPNDLLLFWLQAFIHIVKNEHEEAVQTIQQLLQKIYRIFLEEQNPDAINNIITYFSFESDIENLLIEAHELMGVRFDEPFSEIHQAIHHLINNDIKQFCIQYNRCSSEMINKYIDQILLYAEAIQTYESEHDKKYVFYLQSKDIILDEQNVDLKDILSDYLNNKYHHN